MKPKRYPIALNLPSVVALLIVYGRHVVEMMTNNTWFTNPDPPLATVTTHLDKLEDSEATVRAGTKGAASARDDDEKVVVDDLKALKGYVGKVAAQNPGHESAIIGSSGMFEKMFTSRQKQLLAAYLGPAVGEIRVVAKAVPKGAAYEWQYSTDGGTTWVALSVTRVANTHLLGATPGTTYLFRYRTTRKDTATAWSATVSITVH